MKNSFFWAGLVACSLVSASLPIIGCGGDSGDDPSEQFATSDAAASSDSAGEVPLDDGGIPDPNMSDPDPSSSDDPEEAGANEDPPELTPDAAGASADPCDTIKATANAATNAKTIQDCLNNRGKALLTPGTYPLSTGIKVPGGSILRGVGAPRPLLVLQPQAGGNITNFMLKLGAKTPKTPNESTLISNLRLDGNNAIGNTANAATLMIAEGDGAVVKDTEIFNNKLGPTPYTPAGLYFICSACKKNEVTNVVIYNHYYGVIFRAGLTPALANKISKSTIHDIRCDTVTFAGYGEAAGNKISLAGWGCNNGPIPGGGFYSLNNNQGAKITGNTLFNVCGHGMDIDRVANLTVENNHIYDPGYTWNGTRNYCGGNAGFFLDVRNSKITSNTFENNHRPRNAGGTDPNRVFSASGAGLFSDLPAGSKTVVSFVLAHRSNEPGDSASHNTINRNAFRANCSAAEGCTGLGYFTSRGSGLINGNWSAQTTNYFTNNNPNGSNVGSKRCGANWFAGNSVCNAGSGGQCNTDDYQHTGQFHGDNCRNY